MPTSIVDAESVLVLDLGSISTRALLFDVVDGQYRFIAAGTVPSTAGIPFRDLGEGVHRAVMQLSEVTGRTFTEQDATLILPSRSDGAGVDRLVVTYSVGPQLQIVTMGLLADVSLESAQHLAATTYGKVVESIGLNDRRRSEVQLDAVLRAQPDLIVLAGGTERGATRSVFKLVELISLVCRVMPPEKRPDVLFAGNTVLAKKLQEVLQKSTRVHVAANMRPLIDRETLGPAQDELTRVVTEIRERQIAGLTGLSDSASTPPIPAANAFGRLITFLNQINDPKKGALGVDLGSASTVLAAAVNGELSLQVNPFGVGSGAPALLRQTNLDELLQWMPVQMPADVVSDYVWQKGLYPASLPLTAEAMLIEQGLARQALRLAVQQAQARWPDFAVAFEPILAAGSVLTQAPTPWQTLVTLLDGLQPVGITTVWMDQMGIANALGAIGKLNPLLPVHVLDSGAVLNLGTVVSPISDARFNTPILQVRLEYEEGGEHRYEIRQGSLVSLPLAFGQPARIHFQPLRRVDLDPFHRHGSTSFRIVGGMCGVVIDARGRPITLPAEPARRRELLRRWNTPTSV